MVESISTISPMQYSTLPNTNSLSTASAYSSTRKTGPDHGWDIFDWFEHNDDNSGYEGFVSMQNADPILSDVPLDDMRMGKVQKLGENQYPLASTPKGMMMDENRATIGEILHIHQELVYPKYTIQTESTHDPVTQAWFTHDASKPYPTYGLFSGTAYPFQG